MRRLTRECLCLGASVFLHTLNWLDYKARPNRYRRGW